MTTLVTKPAPNLVSPAVMADNKIEEKFNLKQFLDGKPCVLFFYPMDFTFVCPTELIALDHRYEEFKSRGFEVVTVSCDSQHTHVSWKNTPVEKGGIGKVKYTMVADITKGISRGYGVLVNESVPLRATFIIDKNGIIRHQTVNDLATGRNVDEMLRVIDAIQYVDEHGEVCPAGWNKGKDAMKPDSESVAAYLKNNAKAL